MTDDMQTPAEPIYTLYTIVGFPIIHDTMRRFFFFSSLLLLPRGRSIRLLYEFLLLLQ